MPSMVEGASSGAASRIPASGLRPSNRGPDHVRPLHRYAVPLPRDAGEDRKGQLSAAICRSACSNAAAGWPPLIRYLPSTTTAGTEVIPRARHRSSAPRTSTA